MKASALVTTSWDDGHPLDIRLAEMLARYGVLGTFYIPMHYGRRPVVTEDEIQSASSDGNGNRLSHADASTPHET